MDRAGALRFPAVGWDLHLSEPPGLEPAFRALFASARACILPGGAQGVPRRCAGLPAVGKTSVFPRPALGRSGMRLWDGAGSLAPGRRCPV